MYARELGSPRILSNYTSIIKYTQKRGDSPSGYPCCVYSVQELSRDKEVLGRFDEKKKKIELEKKKNGSYLSMFVMKERMIVGYLASCVCCY